MQWHGSYDHATLQNVSPILIYVALGSKLASRVWLVNDVAHTTQKGWCQVKKINEGYVVGVAYTDDLQSQKEFVYDERKIIWEIKK